jgi:LAO/AO transport system kinase
VRHEPTPDPGRERARVAAEARALTADLPALAASVLAGDRRALARALTLLARDPAAAGELDAAFGRAPAASYSVGVTGAPGAGKSTLVGAMLADAIARGERVAVLALDPQSPLTRGAILGDRLRMEAGAASERAFVRSMTADVRGGGLSTTTPLAMRAVAAAGWPWVLVETVGVGQAELDVVEAASTTVVVLNPGWGDEVQAVKAGLMEVADVFVINKADRDGVDALRHDLERLLAAYAPGRWRPPIVTTVANEGRGVADVWTAIRAHRAELERTGALATRRGTAHRLAIGALARERLDEHVSAVFASPAGQVLLERVRRGELSLPQAAEELVGRLTRGEG